MGPDDIDFAKFTPLLTLVLPILTAIVTWRLTKKKNEADTDNVITSSATSAVQTMSTVLETLHNQSDRDRAEVDRLREENEQLRGELDALYKAKNKYYIKRIKEGDE